MSQLTPGVSAANLSDQDLLRELRHLLETRFETLRHGSDDALEMHSKRCIELEAEYLRRWPEREVDPNRLRPADRDVDLRQATPLTRTTD